MQQIKTTTRLKFWPTPQDYNEALQNPAHAFSDPELKGGQARTDALGLPRPVSGAFASVYQVHTASREWAVRCFLHDIQGQDERYRLISEFVENDQLPYTVGFQYQANGIRISGTQFPLLKMEWVDGLTLDKHVEQCLATPDRLLALAEKFKMMCADLQSAGIAHGDLQHGNIMVAKDELYLVDYDGMFVPSMKGFSSLELGHRAYQHPQRSAAHFGCYLDNFSAWIIYCSLYALGVDPSLHDKLGAGGDCLLFRQQDFLDPTNSCAFFTLEHSHDPQVARLAKFIRAQLQRKPETIPPLTDPIGTVPELPPFVAGIPKSRAEAHHQSLENLLPDWLRRSNANALASDQNAELPPASKKAMAQQKPAQNPPTMQMQSPAAAALPAELMTPLPRKRYIFNEACGKFSPKTRQVFLAIPIIVLAAILGTAIHNDDMLQAHGVVCPGEITDLTFRPGKYSDYDVTYHYHLNAKNYTGWKSVDVPTGNHLRKGQPVLVKAIPSNPFAPAVLPLNSPNFFPEVNPDDFSLENNRATEFSLFVILLFASLAAEIAIWINPFFHRSLALHGHAVWGKVEKKFPASLNSRDGTFVIDYSYVVPQHANRINRQTINLTAEQAKRYSEGGAILVLFDPLAPSNSVPYELCFYHPV